MILLGNLLIVVVMELGVGTTKKCSSFTAITRRGTVPRRVIAVKPLGTVPQYFNVVKFLFF